MFFKSGDKVECIDVGHHVRLLEHKRVYTVASVLSGGYLKLVELEDKPSHSLDPARFNLVKPTVGRKDDSGKLAMNLLDDMPNALAAVVEVMQWAVTDKKPVPYERGSWQGVHADRYREAIKRHDQAACAQEVAEPTKQGARFQRDDETNLLHLAHIATSALMALENTIREIKGKK